ncbi:hypothetical protein ACFX58_13890 [Sphingomonas sp. NCPPB 2930]
MFVSIEIGFVLTPKGHLRAPTNLGNPILANCGAAGQPAGASMNLAWDLAERLGVGIKLVVFESAGKSVAAVIAEEAHAGFFAIAPLRGEGILFTSPYVLIEGAYAAADASALKAHEEVDHAGILRLYVEDMKSTPYLNPPPSTRRAS